MKYLVLLVVVVVAIGAWRSRRAPAAASAARKSQTQAVIPQDMLACARCGVHVPQAEALVAGGQAYCCAEHQRQGPA